MEKRLWGSRAREWHNRFAKGKDGEFDRHPELPITF
jgi:hypothetical protein